MKTVERGEETELEFPYFSLNYELVLLADVFCAVACKTGGTIVKQDIGVFDDTTEAVMILWGAATQSSSSWVISKTSL
jgi:hypothetical protein